MLTLTNRIDMRPGAVPLVIHLGQYDSDFSLVFELYSSAGNFTVESGTTAMIRGTKTDGNAYDADATIDVSAKTVTVAGSEQMTAAKGRNVYELVLTKSSKVLSTANFILDVERAAMDADTIASESVLKELNAIIAGAETATEAAANAASAADRAEDAAESVSSASTQIATNTADIADLKEDFEQLEPGLSDEAKEALLACFRHVVWTDGESQTYYDELEAALNNSGRTLESIRAAYISAGHTVYPWDTLDSLKPYLTVTAVYSDASEAVVSEYDLSGNLSTATSVITVGYSEKTTQVNVNVTIDSALLYYLPTGTVLDGTASGGFDTGIKLSDTNKAISFIIDATDEEILTRVRSPLLVSDRNASANITTWQFGFTGAQSDDTYTKQYYTIAVGAPTSQKSSAVANTAHRLKIAVIHPSNTNTYTLFMSVDGVVMYDFTSQTGRFAANDQTAFIGKRPDNQYPCKGTLTTCAIFGRALSKTEARELLGVN